MEGINDDSKEGNEGINDLISAGREMNYQTTFVLLTSNIQPIYVLTCHQRKTRDREFQF